MLCPKCGLEAQDGAERCKQCGAALPPGQPPEQQRKPAEKPMMAREEKISGQITLCEDGKYRWVYEMSLLKNPTVFWLVWKIFFFIFLAVFAVTMIADAVEWADFFPDRFLNNLKFLGYFLAGMTAVVGLGYLLYAAMMGGKYVVEFEMNEQGVLHRQIAAQAKKARKLGQATMLAGAVSGRMSTVIAGRNARRTELYSDFSRVRTVKARPRRHLIQVNERLSHNQVYAAPEDFAFVLEYLQAHCQNARKPGEKA